MCVCVYVCVCVCVCACLTSDNNRLLYSISLLKKIAEHQYPDDDGATDSNQNTKHNSHNSSNWHWRCGILNCDISNKATTMRILLK